MHADVVDSYFGRHLRGMLDRSQNGASFAHSPSLSHGLPTVTFGTQWFTQRSVSMHGVSGPQMSSCFFFSTQNDLPPCAWQYVPAAQTWPAFPQPALSWTISSAAQTAR